MSTVLSSIRAQIGFAGSTPEPEMSRFSLIVTYHFGQLIEMTEAHHLSSDGPRSLIVDKSKTTLGSGHPLGFARQRDPEPGRILNEHGMGFRSIGRHSTSTPSPRIC